MRNHEARHGRVVTATIFLVFVFGVANAEALVDLARDTPCGSPDDDRPSPQWDLVELAECQGTCNWNYATQRRMYNICYACVCLLNAAEHEGERESALAQCEAALEY